MQARSFSDEVGEHQRFPDSNRLSVLVSIILLVYILAPYLNKALPGYAIQLPGFYLELPLNWATLLYGLVAVLAAAGTDWLLRSHPVGRKQKTLFVHWLLPALTAWVVGLPLNTLVFGWQWWIVFSLGSLLIILVFLAEFIVVDFSDTRHAPATMGLTALAFALYLMVAVAVRAANMRLYLILPVLVISVALVALRTLYLRLGGRWCLPWAIGISLVIGQFAIGLHYWPLPPLVFGLTLLGPAYALTSLAGAVEESRPWKALWIEPTIMLVIIWGMAYLLS